MRVTCFFFVLVSFFILRSNGEIIHGNGADSLSLLFSALGDVYTATHNPDVKLEYESTSSILAEESLIDGTSIFGGTERRLRDAQYEEVPDLQMLPFVVNGYIPYTSSYLKLVLTGEALAQIFMGNVTHWDDPLITVSNPSKTFEHSPITVIYREGRSGATAIFTRAMSFMSDEWSERYGRIDTWPEELTNMTSFIGAEDDIGMLTTSDFTTNSISYVTFNLAFRQASQDFGVRLINENGKSITCNTDSINKAAANPTFTDRFTGVLLDPEDPDAWPICTYSYIILRMNSTAPELCEELTEFLRFLMYTTFYYPTTVMLLEDNGYGGTSAERSQLFVANLANVTCNGERALDLTNFILPVSEESERMYYSEEYETYTPISEATYSPFFDSIGSPISQEEANSVVLSSLSHLEETMDYFYYRFYYGKQDSSGSVSHLSFIPLLTWVFVFITL